MHDVETYIDLDSMIHYTISKHGVDYVDPNEIGKDSDNCSTELLAYMAGQKSSSGDIRQVLASKQAPDKNKKRQVNEGTSDPSTVTIFGTTYYLHNRETINFYGHQYSAHMSKVH
jgi:hypothetical protein